jgi:hypothetical protein
MRRVHRVGPGRPLAQTERGAPLPSSGTTLGRLLASQGSVAGAPQHSAQLD